MMQVSRNIGGRDVTLCLQVLIRGVPGKPLHFGMVQVFSVTEHGCRLVGVLADSQDVALLVDGPHHPSQRLLLPQQSVVLRDQHVNRNPVDVESVQEVLNRIRHPLYNKIN